MLKVALPGGRTLGLNEMERFEIVHIGKVETQLRRRTVDGMKGYEVARAAILNANSVGRANILISNLS